MKIAVRSGRYFVLLIYLLTKYILSPSSQLQLELQPDILNGSTANQARFGAAIANIGDINKDSFDGKHKSERKSMT